MKNKWLVTFVALLMVGTSAEMVAQTNKKTVAKATKQYTKYVKDKAQGKEKTAQMRSSDPATVTRERDSVVVEEIEKDPMRSAYDKFRQQARTEYDNFRDRANQEYAEFVKRAWQQFHAKPAVPRPVEKEIPPVVIKEEDKQKPIENRPLSIDEDVVTLPAPNPQPVPVAPIREQSVDHEESVPFIFYGTNLNVRFSEEQRFFLADCSEQSVSDAWKKLSGKMYNNTIRDCLELRITRQLSDWAYLQMLDKFSKTCLGNGNEAVLMTAYIYCQSGYKMRLGTTKGKLCLLYASEHNIYNHPYYTIGDDVFYIFNSDEISMKICDVAFPKEKSLSLYISQEQQFEYVESDGRHLKSSRYTDMDIICHVNKNLMPFYNDYPSSYLSDNIMTRWAMLANTPMEKGVKENVYPQLQGKIKGLSKVDAMERLLNWVQTAFVYEYDDKVWGYDRAFFAEETLFYPYCDCEDRAILLSRLVRDLLGLKTILVYYPGHLAMAVAFTEDVKGDYIILNGNKFVVCDPTYIGASVGMTMPDMDNKTAKVILLGK